MPAQTEQDCNNIPFQDEDNRQLLNKGDILWLSYQKSGEPDVSYRIEGVLGKGASGICYDAVRMRDGKRGKLKEFYPRDMRAVGKNGEELQNWFYSLERTPEHQLVPGAGTIRRFEMMCEEYLKSYRLFNQLISGDNQHEVLKNYIQDWEILYGTLTEEKNAWTRFFSRFLHEKEPEPEMATVYVWTAGLSGESFDQYLDQVRQNPLSAPGKRLQEILLTMAALTDAISAIHTARLLHLDIKPSNFLVSYNSSHEIDPARISMFDIDSLYNVDDSFAKITGTEGYRAPEVLSGMADNRSDIYSIGATLFHAIIINQKHAPNGLYQDSYYSRIDQFLKNSELILGSVSNSDAKLLLILSGILKKCLAPNPNNRYQNCPSLQADLKKAVAITQINTIGPETIGDNKKIAVVPKNEEGIVSPTLAIQKLLHDHPLYEGLPAEARDLHVLVIGAGVFGQKFLDLCLQMGQMAGYRCHVYAVSDDAQENRREYLHTRPALKRFVDVDGSWKEDPDRCYGSLRFLSLSEFTGSAEKEAYKTGDEPGQQPANDHLTRQVLSRFAGQDQPVSYVFIALGSDQMNQSVALSFQNLSGKASGKGNILLPPHSPVCYVTEQENPFSGSKKARGIPVPINESITHKSIDPQLVQMAFNTHLSWLSSRNIDIDKEYTKFCQSSYDFESSIAYALSIQYKLYSIGIRMVSSRQENPQDQDGFYIAKDASDASSYFHRNILVRRSLPEVREKFDALVAYEHRRWIISLITEGWDAPRNRQGYLDLQKCVDDGAVRNQSAFTHPCLVHSRPGNPLDGQDYQAGNHAKWEQKKIDPALDDLDRMSLKLHQLFRERAEAFKKKSPLYMGDVRDIEEMTSSYGDAVLQSFKEFQFCLKNILDGVESYTRQYGYYEEELKKAIKSCPPSVISQIEDKLALVKKSFFPVMEANLYRNYKDNDVILLENTPFILSCRFPRSIAVPFVLGDAGDPETVFSNVAGVTMLSPSRVLFLYRFTENNDIPMLSRALSNVIAYLNRREVRCEVMFIAGVHVDVPACTLDQLQIALDKLIESTAAYPHACLKKYQVEEYQAYTDRSLPENEGIYSDSGIETRLFLELLKNAKTDKLDLLFDASHGFSQNPVETTLFLNALEKNGIPYFSFDYRTKTFSACPGCEYLAYIKNHSCLRINDVFTLLGAKDNRISIPEYSEDYQKLWEIYCGSYDKTITPGNAMQAWNAFVAKLKLYFSGLLPLTVFKRSDLSARPGIKSWVYYVPEFAFARLSSLVETLKENGLCENDSFVEHYASQEAKVFIKAPEGLYPAYTAVIDNVDKLEPYYEMQAVPRKTASGRNDIQIRINELNVTDLSLNDMDEEKRKNVERILKELEKQSFIRGLSFKTASGNRTCSFRIASPRIKNLLTEEGMMLEIYTYYQALKTGYFDDVACGYEFEYEDNHIRNELDVIMTKGFRTIIMECKAKTDVRADTIYKLDSVVSRIGIAPVKVLVSKQEQSEESDVRKRGDMADIIIISGQEIPNIGEAIKDKLEALHTQNPQGTM